MDKESLKEDFYYLIGYMLTSANGLYKEPADYGVIRLLDTTERLISILEDHNIADHFLLHLRDELKEEKEGAMDNERRKVMIRRLVMEYTEELEHHLG